MWRPLAMSNEAVEMTCTTVMVIFILWMTFR